MEEKQVGFLLDQQYRLRRNFWSARYLYFSRTESIIVQQYFGQQLRYPPVFALVSGTVHRTVSLPSVRFPSPTQKTPPPLWGSGVFWSRVRESNPTKILAYQCFFTLMAVFVAELILKF